MFATQHYRDAMPDAGRKRLRDDDDAGHGVVGLSQHRKKRIQSLPLRSSPKPGQQWLPSATVTPVHATCRSHFSPWSSSPPAVGSQPADMDMDDVTPSSPSPYRVDQGLSAMEICDRDAIGRMPTPIQPSFAAQVRGQHCEWAGPGPALKTPHGIVNLGHHQAGLTADVSIPRALASAPSDWHSLHNNRRLPSPISETGDVGQPSMMVDDDRDDVDGRIDTVPSALMRCSSADAMHHPNAAMGLELCQRHAADSDSGPMSPSPGRSRGHVRSKHTVNSWTWQPGMKKSFSIGYRSDCEKCRLKVPGHFNHIIIS
ncbi:DNA polymerase III subunits gamma and tau-like protein [Ophiocordyceps camponoti-floridani]|uniref:DNA polymerase III subunits gamma and tau-like protein n=1 Tax=Ophiocordyceps camponoti-floridani TaxID=2030778 RepID=A0A8H4QDD0_9HYPO|nr:DNA polymerase III subunits gamma and tau-like protein [Ophiocordyceps camponoti-floridani]